MLDVKADGRNSSHRCSETLQQHWSAMRRLSEQLTEATLAAMQVADANSPGKALLDVPLPACPKCHNKDTFFSSSLYDEPPSHSGSCRIDMQRYGRSKSVAIASMDQGCKYCTPFYYQNPLKDHVWSRPSLHNSRNPLQKRSSCRSRFSSATPFDLEADELPYLSGFFRDSILPDFRPMRDPGRRSSSFTDIPHTASQHTQTIFSSIATSNEFGTPAKPRSRVTSGSMYSKHTSGLRFQLPAALQKTKSFRKRGLDFGLRKTLSVTNAVVRMPIESQTSKKESKTKLIGSEEASLVDNASPTQSYDHPPSSPLSIPQLPRISKRPVLRTELSNASEPGCLLSWSHAPPSGTPPWLEEGVQPRSNTTDARIPSQRRLSRSEGHIERATAFLHDETPQKQPEPQVLPKRGKRDVQLQTMEDFEKEITNSFNIPRILREEDQTKEPGEETEAHGCASSSGGIDDTTKQRSAEYWKDQFMTFFQPSDNKLAKKLFGTKMALNKERSRQRKQGKWIIHPASNFR